MTSEIDELLRFIRRSSKAVPDARIVVAVLTSTDEGKVRATFALTSNVDQVADGVAIADQILRHASVAIARGLHPECDVCRDRVKRVEAARAALDVERPGAVS